MNDAFLRGSGETLALICSFTYEESGFQVALDKLRSLPKVLRVDLSGFIDHTTLFFFLLLDVLNIPSLILLPTFVIEKHVVFCFSPCTCLKC